MILQVNKKRLKDKDTPENFSNDVFFDFYEGLESYSIKQKLIPSSEYPRKSGKTTTLKRLAERYKVPYISSFSNTREIRESVEWAKQNNRIIIVDQVDTSTILELNNNRITAVGIVQNNHKNIQVSPSKRSKTNEVFEDYIEISSVMKLSDGIGARAKQYDIHLSYDKEFYNDSYGIENQDFYIESVYLLDDTGKTIKRLM